LKWLAKLATGRLSSETLERALALALVQRRFAALRDVPAFDRREDLWSDTLDRIGDAPVCVLEFGVWQGYSLRFLAEANRDPRSTFHGFDSFEGLPEDWIHIPKGTFARSGDAPSTDDPRVRFHKGWFQNTLPPFLAANRPTLEGELVVHYDADLYSSTLFCLAAVDGLKRPYHAIFDEFTGHEARALHNYLQAFGAEVAFTGQVGRGERWPSQVACRITPATEYTI
jgi:hypothetical protein